MWEPDDQVDLGFSPTLSTEFDEMKSVGYYTN